MSKRGIQDVNDDIQVENNNSITQVDNPSNGNDRSHSPEHKRGRAATSKKFPNALSIENPKTELSEESKALIERRKEKLRQIPGICCPIPLKSLQSALLCFVEGTAKPPMISKLLDSRPDNLPPKAILLVLPRFDLFFLNDIMQFNRRPFPMSNLSLNVKLLQDMSQYKPITEMFEHYFSYGCVTSGGVENPKQFFNELMQLKFDYHGYRRHQQQRAQMYAEDVPRQYIMSQTNLISKNFPLPLETSGKPIPPGWVQFVSYDPNGPQTPFTFIALDCEMCTTAVGPELARISLVDHNGKTILDSLVKPPNPIINYLTEFSGITPELLENVTTTLEDIQNQLREIINPSVVLIGHGLAQDLNATRLIHPYIIDTTTIYSHHKGPPLTPALKYLAEKWLERNIRCDTVVGHNPVEDALTTMDLVKLKIQKDNNFGMLTSETETIFNRLARNENVRTAIVDYANARMVSDGATYYHICENDTEIKDKVLQSLEDPNVNLIVARFQKLQERINSHSDIEMQKTIFIEYLDYLKEILEALPPQTLVTISTLNSYRPKITELSMKESIYKQHLEAQRVQELTPDQYWTKDNSIQLREEMEKSKQGLSLFGIKP